MKDDDYTLLIGIGAQKSGTTWISNYFTAHESVFMSPIKELHYFDADVFFDADKGGASWNTGFVNQFKKLVNSLEEDQFCHENYEMLQVLLYRIGMIYDESMYAKYFAEFRKNEKVVCEISPGYSTVTAHEFKRMVEIHHTVKFLFIMRNPADRFWSQLKYKSMRLKYDHNKEFENYLSHPGFNLRADYRRTITELLSVVDKNDVHFVFYENLFSNKAISSLCAFLDIEYMQADFSKRPNPSFVEDIDKAKRQQVFKKFSFVYNFIDDYFKGEIPTSWKQDMMNYG